jgi:hypothetical protein
LPSRASRDRRNSQITYVDQDHTSETAADVMFVILMLKNVADALA